MANNQHFQYINKLPYFKEIYGKSKIWSQYKQLTVGSLNSATCPPIFMQLTGQNNGGIACPAFLLARTCIMKMRNVTCVGTQTSKVPTRVTLLFINYSVLWWWASIWLLKLLRCVIQVARGATFSVRLIKKLNCFQLCCCTTLAENVAPRAKFRLVENRLALFISEVSP